MKCLQFVFVLLVTPAVSAQQIYKSVDHNGHVSYSSFPGKGAMKVETVAPPPPPDPLEVERAQQRLREWEASNAEREIAQREQERENLRQKQIREDLQLKRRIAKQKPTNIAGIDQNPYSYYWGAPYQPAGYYPPNYWNAPYQPTWNYQPAPITQWVPDNPHGWNHHGPRNNRVPPQYQNPDSDHWRVPSQPSVVKQK